MNNNYIPVISEDTKQPPFMAFYVKDRKYAVEINNVIEVINLPEMEFPASLPKGIIGIFDYKGTMIKAIDLCPFLGFNASEFSVNNRFIIVSQNDNIFAINTNAIDNIVIPENNEIQSVPFEKENSIIGKIYKKEDNIINIVNLEMLSHNISENKNQIGTVDYSLLIPSDEKSKEIFKIRTEQNKKNTDLFSFSFNLNSINQYVLFTLSDHCYFLNLKHVKEFVSRTKLSTAKLPYTKDYIKGLVNIKGQFLVVFDLKCLINGVPSENDKNSKIIVVEGKNFNIGLLVDDVKYIRNIDAKYLQKPNCVISKYIFSEFEEDGTIYSIINFDKIINDEKLYINIED